jgi:hypothetical protein
MLRHSTEPDIANNVYTIADLSPAAIQPAYEARKARRQAAERRRKATDRIESAGTAAAATNKTITVNIDHKPVATYSDHPTV